MLLFEVNLFHAPSNNNKDMGGTAAEALGYIGDARAVRPLIALLKNKDRYGHEAAAEALGKIGDDRAVEPLVTALKDEDVYVRLAAA